MIEVKIEKQKKKEKKKREHKIINSKKALDVMGKIEKLFKEEDLTMIDIEYVVSMLQRTVDMWDKGKSEEAWMICKLREFMVMLRDEQIRRDL